ncbi:MAG: PepSY-like domain-containing protein [Bacteroidales bacterium]|nr:PepSY-like domain-containing protein [Bacteroidales bacterium]
MKQTKYVMLALLCLMMSAVCRADDTPIAPDALPAAAKTFVSTNFPGKKIIYAEKDWNSYECRLDDGTKIEFNKKGNWDKVDCHMQAVPAAIVPDAIQKYVKANFPDCLITKIDKERYGYEIELSNDLDLRFSYQGALLGMDD